MSARAWTPGPWSYVRNGMDSRWIIDGRIGRALACTAGFECDNEANARLIAAAPDLAIDGAFLLDRLAELEQTMEAESGDAAVRDWHGHVAPAIARFRAAITKAGAA